MIMVYVFKFSEIYTSYTFHVITDVWVAKNVGLTVNPAQVYWKLPTPVMFMYFAVDNSLDPFTIWILFWVMGLATLSVYNYTLWIANYLNTFHSWFFFFFFAMQISAYSSYALETAEKVTL